MEFIAESFASSSLKNSETRIEFPENRWDAGPFFKWYKSPDTLKRISKLEIRMTQKVVPHRFVIAHMVSEDGAQTAVYRFDRRPNVLPHHVLLTVHRGHSGPAKDEYTVVEDSSYEDAVCEVTLDFSSKRVDLSSIIKTCFVISQNPNARNYELRKYNCFFFSWTILMVVAREFLPYRVPVYETIRPLCYEQLPGLTSRITARAVDLLQAIILDMTSKFHSKSNEKLESGLGPLEKAAWGLPTHTLRGILDTLFRTQLRFGMREKLSKHIEEAIVTRAESVWSTVLSSRLSPEKLDSKLWLYDMQVIIEQELTDELYRGLWDGILSAIAGGQELEQLPPGDSDIKLPVPVVGKQAAQLSVIWKWAIPALLLGAKDAALGQPSSCREHNKIMFDLAWSGGAKAAIETAKSVVRRTRSQFTNKKRHDRLWSAVWEIWDTCEREAWKFSQERALAVIDAVVEDIVKTGAENFKSAMESTKLESIEGHFYNKAELQHEPITLTSLTLESGIQKIMYKNVASAKDLTDVKKMIGIVWEKYQSL
ncbi:hypothetical protein RhiJN_08115 [Ceratobasidium sp. AG-Ba]|nr:hypothetical protein RhiJN_08115 [Ceratobasidium sp. AG-Ba]QRW08873.1 hypothetical protein RhiLY_07872 [Ceratobasidium sp. AG-Ba]